MLMIQFGSEEGCIFLWRLKEEESCRTNDTTIVFFTWPLRGDGLKQT